MDRNLAGMSVSCTSLTTEATKDVAQLRDVYVPNMCLKTVQSIVGH